MSVLVFRNGSIGIGAAAPRALAVEGGLIAALGDDAEERANTADDVVDLEGGVLLPSFGDGHAHPLNGGLDTWLADLQGAASISEVQERVRAWAEAHPLEPWVRGDGYDPTLAPEGVFLAEWLDEVCADRPVWLRASDFHTAWVNTRALEAAGIDHDTEEPPDGEIVRDRSRVPVGTLREWGAWRLVERAAPPIPAATSVQAISAATTRLAAAGITWVQDAWVEPDALSAWATAAETGRTSIRANLAFLASPASWRRDLDAARSGRAELRRRAPGRVTGHTVKFFADGVIEAGTGAVIEPYVGCAHSRGVPNWDAGELARAVCAFDGHGFQVHIHAIGDAGVRAALDAVEYAERQNGARDRRPVIAHAQLIDPVDIPRFARLGVVANVQPLWACADSVMTELTLPRLGERRGRAQYPFATLARTARISFGSDWPVSSFEPWAAIAVAISRQVPGEWAASWVPAERLTLEEAIQAYTSGVAYQAFEESLWGDLTVGARADLMALPADPSTLAVPELARLAPSGVWIEGARLR